MAEARMTCADVRENAAEVALGTVSGPERAAALEHLAGCGDCRGEVESLADVADSLLLLAPQAEPTLGFETRVTDRLAGAGLGLSSPRPRRRPLIAMTAVAAAVLGIVLGFTGLYERHRSNRLDREYVNALRVLGGKALFAGRLSGADGRGTGEVFVYDGHPSWVFVTISDPDASGPLTVDLQWNNRGPVTLTGLTVSNGVGSLGARLTGSADGLESVRVRGNGVDYMGHFDGQPADAGTMP